MKRLSLDQYHQIYYREHIDKQISDRTWYRVKKELKRFIGEVDTNLLLFVATVKKVSPHLSVESLAFAYNKFKNKSSKDDKKFMIGTDLLDLCNTITKGKPNRSTVNRWFKTTKFGYVSDANYSKSECLIIIAKAYTYKSRNGK